MEYGRRSAWLKIFSLPLLWPQEWLKNNEIYQFHDTCVIELPELMTDVDSLIIQDSLQKLSTFSLLAEKWERPYRESAEFKFKFYLSLFLKVVWFTRYGTKKIRSARLEIIVGRFLENFSYPFRPEEYENDHLKKFVTTCKKIVTFEHDADHPFQDRKISKSSPKDQDARSDQKNAFNPGSKRLQ
uniref:Uncharacterized protein n=1 Tax=Romanomermis culicivorax TaxID=13658 RepID=A0A915KEH1_ROMCU